MNWKSTKKLLLLRNQNIIYLNALDGKGVIVSTVNEYLAQTDSEEMGEVFKWLGLTVGLNKSNMPPQMKRLAYSCDIT